MKRQTLLLLAIILLGLNLRPVLAAVGPLLDRIQLDTHLGHVGASLLTSLPIVIMGLGALAATFLRGRFGERRGIWLGTLLIALACLARGLVPSATPLLISALLAGAGIAFVQALLPGLIKARFSHDAGRLIGFYSCAIMGGAAFGAALTPWLAQWLGWSWALATWALPAIIACLLWKRAAPADEPTTSGSAAPLNPWRSPRAWLLMAFFGVGTAGYTLVLAWLPPYYTSLGWSAESSGLLLAALTLCEVTAGLLASSLLARCPDRRVLLSFVLVCLLLGLIALVLAPLTLVVPICVLIGIGIGALFPLSLVVAQDHLDDPRQTGDLLAFVQGGGYLIAATSPLLAGLLRQYTNNLRLSWLMMAAATLVLMLMAKRFKPGSGHFHTR
ncbi:CynX/NimT family MFS transporter [Pseudomonas argentinensis]|uniref:MFS transporter, CP family, cyanate transporter n=1 Tax=Phytopseudomonas argentinensis TaxID=289370 RepID=A0A1I3K9K6_9GAMM|nr:cyanate transporter [Pseudomonas argentinensis]KAB0550729.1 CynX/NimT family MFS transporter [Pseudomonas argentinensis]SFI69064.1 MFS transporter, CP family, cyanate transporter [Pseudomonas argentinensis]